jgi:WD40 repeat protein
MEHRHLDGVVSLMVHGDKLLSGFIGNTIKVLSTDTWVCERTIQDYNTAINCLLVHGDKLFSSSSDNTIKVWSS